MLKPTQDGHIAEKDLVHALKQNTGLVSLFGVNHEIGVINNIQNLGKILKNNNIIFHCDATQALGKITLNCQELPIDMMSFSGHKIYGPKGVGALYVRRDLLKELCPLIHGGGQEWCKRSGTLNVPGIVGLGEAVRLITSEMPKDIPRIKNLRDRLLTNLSCLDNIYINGSLKNRVAHNLNISFAGIDGEELILSICDRVAVSTGSACASAKGASSAVLAQLGVNAELRQATLRFGIGRFNTIEEIDDASELIITQVKKLRKNKFIMLKRS